MSRKLPILLVLFVFVQFSQSSSSSCGYLKQVKTLQCYQTVIQAGFSLLRFQLNNTLENEVKAHGKCQLFLSCLSEFSGCEKIFGNLKTDCEEVMEGGRFEKCVKEIQTSSPDPSYYSTCLSQPFISNSSCSTEQHCSNPFATSICDTFLAKLFEIQGTFNSYSKKNMVPKICIRNMVRQIV